MGSALGNGPGGGKTASSIDLKVARRTLSGLDLKRSGLSRAALVSAEHFSSSAASLNPEKLDVEFSISSLKLHSRGYIPTVVLKFVIVVIVTVEFRPARGAQTTLVIRTLHDLVSAIVRYRVAARVGYAFA